MINLFKTQNTPCKPDQYPSTKSGSFLLRSQQRKNHLLKIKRLLSVTDEIWENHYLYAILRFCEYVQDVPGSELHHHNYKGGLIDHTLEALHLGIKASHGFVIPPNTHTEKITSQADKWRFGIFIAILAHDIGKVVTDIEFVYKHNNKFVMWHPWNGVIPQGIEYKFRYKEKTENSFIGKSLHEKGSLTLLPKLLTKEATLWLFSDQELLAQIFSTITHSAIGNEVLAKILRIADMSSVSKNMGGVQNKQENFQTDKKPFQDKILASLRKLANDGTLKRNRPGAALWVTRDHTWVVSKVGMEAVREQLEEEGHKSIPRNVIRFFSTLNESGSIIKTANGDSIWKAHVFDRTNGWKQKLTFLKFENATIWPTKLPSIFDGEVIASLVTEEGGVKEESLEVNKLNTERTLNTADKIKAKPNINEKKNIRGGEGSLQNKIGMASRNFGTKNIHNIAFFVWLIRNIDNYKIRVNEAKSLVHLIENYVILVTPAIFIEYLTSNPDEKRLYTSKSGHKAPFTALQREVESLDIHKRSKTGNNMVNVRVQGVRHKSSFTGYALKRENFPELDRFSVSNAISIE